MEGTWLPIGMLQGTFKLLCIVDGLNDIGPEQRLTLRETAHL